MVQIQGKNQPNAFTGTLTGGNFMKIAHLKQEMLL